VAAAASFRIDGDISRIRGYSLVVIPWEVSSDIPLQCFRIDGITLEPAKKGRIVLDLESHFGHFDEHGCYILVRDGKIERYGEWDEVPVGEEDGDDDFGDDDFDDEE
jgi:hypothetical protein